MKSGGRIVGSMRLGRAGGMRWPSGHPGLSIPSRRGRCCARAGRVEPPDCPVSSDVRASIALTAACRSVRSGEVVCTPRAAHCWFQLSALAGIGHWGGPPASRNDESSSLSGSSICPKNVLFFGHESRQTIIGHEHHTGCPASTQCRFEHRRRHFPQGAPCEGRYRVHTDAVCGSWWQGCRRQGFAAIGRTTRAAPTVARAVRQASARPAARDLMAVG